MFGVILLNKFPFALHSFRTGRINELVFLKSALNNRPIKFSSKIFFENKEFGLQIITGSGPNMYFGLCFETSRCFQSLGSCQACVRADPSQNDFSSVKSAVFQSKSIISFAYFNRFPFWTSVKCSVS